MPNPLNLKLWTWNLKRETLNLEPIVVLMTAASAAEAEDLGEMLVNKKLAACVQILPQIQSIYRWKGSTERAAEVLLIVKTELHKFAELEQQVRAMHSYETPEIVALAVADISAPYRAWLTSNLGSD
jgi:periplasmic divalent cation tolerance protein